MVVGHTEHTGIHEHEYYYQINDLGEALHYTYYIQLM